MGHKHNHILNFIQKISFMRFALSNESLQMLSFLTNVKFSYFDFGLNTLSLILPSSYVEQSDGLFNQSSVDANIIRNTEICIIITIVLFVITIVQLIMNKIKSQFSIANLTFANKYGMSMNENIFKTSIALSIFYLIFYLIMSVSMLFANVSLYTKVENVG
jgi:hypothetical protein